MKKTDLSSIILFVALSLGLVFWVLDGLLAFYVFHPEHYGALWDAFFPQALSQTLFVRLYLLVVCLVMGWLVLRFLSVQRDKEKVLWESQDRYRRLVEGAPLGIISVDMQGWIVDVNPMLLIILGLPSAEAARSINVLTFSPLIASGVAEGFRSCLKLDTFDVPEHHYTTKWGSYIYLQYHLTSIRDENGSIVGAQGIVEDVTERVLARQKIERLNEELEQRVAERTALLKATNKELEAFAYSVSHDLRAPLRSIDGFSQALLEDYADRLDVVGQDYLKRVRAATGRMGQIIDDLLKLSRLAREEMCYERVDLTKLAHEVLNELQAAHPERQVEFVVDPGLVVKADRRLLRIVLENLLGNAWKFTAKQDQARIVLGKTEMDAEGVYYVRDNGAGFDMRYADRLFGAFQRLHSEAEFKGTGIGLATVKRIIHRHSGRVWAQSVMGQGATFYFVVGNQ